MAKQEYYLGGRELQSPFFNAAGLINHPNINSVKRDAWRLGLTGVGAIQYGSVTLPPSQGNEAVYGAPTDYYDHETETMTNAKGLPNPGRKVMLAHSEELVDIAHVNEKLAIVSVSPTKDVGDPVEQAVKLAEDFLETDFDFVEINVACPNIVTEGGDRKPIMGYDLIAMKGMIKQLEDRVGRTNRLILKTANHLTAEQRAIVPDLAELILASNVFVAIETPNTIPNHVPLNAAEEPILSVPGGAGGLSGPATAYNGRDQLQMWSDELEGSNVDIISTQGVHSAEEMAWRLGHGAAAVSGVHVFWNSTHLWDKTVHDLLDEFARLPSAA